MPQNRITDIPGLRVGHATDLRLASGVTAILFDQPAVAAVDGRTADERAAARRALEAAPSAVHALTARSRPPRPAAARIVR